MKKINVGIVGGAGYTAGELIRLLINHPEAKIDFVFSTSNAGNKISKVHQDLVGTLDLKFTDTVNPDVDVLFLCLGHGNSVKFLSANTFSKDTKIIDLGNDFRLEENKIFNGKTFVYGLPELQREAVKKARYIANPGCFATAIQLGLLPLAKAGLLNADVHVNAVTGATGQEHPYRQPLIILGAIIIFRITSHLRTSIWEKSTNRLSSCRMVLIGIFCLCPTEVIFQEVFLPLCIPISKGRSRRPKPSTAIFITMPSLPLLQMRSCI